MRARGRELRLTRRALVLGALLAVPAQAAHAALPDTPPPVVDCVTYMLHHVGGGEVAGLIERNVAAGRRPVTVGQLGDYLMGREPVPAEPLFCLSFDDGYLDQYTNGLPVLRRYQCPATFFVMGTSWRGDRVHAYMSPAQLREAAEHVEIGSHTINHDPNMLALRGRDRGAYWWEIAGSKCELEELVGRPVPSFSSPVSVYDEAMRADVAAAGYELAVMTFPDQERVPTRLTAADRLRIPRKRIT